MEQRDDGAARGIAADRAPGDEVIAEHQQEADAGDDPAQVVAQRPPEELRLGRRRDRGRRQRGHHGEPFARRQALGGLDGQRAIVGKPALPVMAARAARTGEGDEAFRPRAADEMQVIGGGQDRELPEIAGDVPVQFRLAVEPAHLPADTVAEHVGVLAVADVSVLVAGIDADGVVHALGEIGLRLAVAHDAEQREGDFVHDALRVLEEQGEVAIDAVADLAAFGVDAEGLGDGELAVLGEMHVGDEGLDGFGSDGVGGGAERERDGERWDRRKAEQAFHGGKSHDWAGLSETRGTARSASSEISKNVRSENPKLWATMLLGNDWTSVLRLRTVPL